MIQGGSGSPYAAFFGPLLGQQLGDLQRLAKELGEDREVRRVQADTGSWSGSTLALGLLHPFPLHPTHSCCPPPPPNTQPPHTAPGKQRGTGSNRPPL